MTRPDVLASTGACFPEAPAVSLRSQQKGHREDRCQVGLFLPNKAVRSHQRVGEGMCWEGAAASCQSHSLLPAHLCLVTIAEARWAAADTEGGGGDLEVRRVDRPGTTWWAAPGPKAAREGEGGGDL